MITATPSARVSASIASRRARCADERRIEVRDVLAEHGRRVAAGIHAHERNCGALARGQVGKRLSRRRKRRERRRADVRTVHEAEEHECPVSPQLLRPERMAGLVRERERGQRPRLLNRRRPLEDGRRRSSPRREVCGGDAGNQPCDHDAGDEHAIHGRELSHGRAPAGRRLNCPR